MSVENASDQELPKKHPRMQRKEEYKTCHYDQRIVDDEISEDYQK